MSAVFNWLYSYIWTSKESGKELTEVEKGKELTEVEKIVPETREPEPGQETEKEQVEPYCYKSFIEYIYNKDIPVGTRQDYVYKNYHIYGNELQLHKKELYYVSDLLVEDTRRSRCACSC
jgi:hypothetical protein